MKRESYIVKCNGEQVAVKHAWNSALREIIKLVDARIDELGGRAEEIEVGPTEKDITGRHVCGSRVWRGENGKTLEFEVIRE